MRDFLQAVALQFPSHSKGTDQRAAAMLQRAEQVVDESRSEPTVAELWRCSVKHRDETLSSRVSRQSRHGAGHLSSPRAVESRASSFTAGSRSDPVTDIALNLGFWHVGRFAEQYDELFGESPHETLGCSDTEISKRTRNARMMTSNSHRA